MKEDNGDINALLKHKASEGIFNSGFQLVLFLHINMISRIAHNVFLKREHKTKRKEIKMANHSAIIISNTTAEMVSFLPLCFQHSCITALTISFTTVELLL